MPMEYVECQHKVKDCLVEKGHRWNDPNATVIVRKCKPNDSLDDDIVSEYNVTITQVFACQSDLCNGAEDLDNGMLL